MKKTSGFSRISEIKKILSALALFCAKAKRKVYFSIRLKPFFFIQAPPAKAGGNLKLSKAGGNLKLSKAGSNLLKNLPKNFNQYHFQFISAPKKKLLTEIKISAKFFSFSEQFSQNLFLKELKAIKDAQERSGRNKFSDRISHNA